MPSNPLCERCGAHRPRTRRTCWMCSRRVGAGCWPEKCLVIDGWDGHGRPSICRDCWPSFGPAPVSRSFNEIWAIVERQDFEVSKCIVRETTNMLHTHPSMFAHNHSIMMCRKLAANLMARPTPFRGSRTSCLKCRTMCQHPPCMLMPRS